MVIFLACDFGTTVTRHLYFLFFIFAVIVALPAFFALILPFWVTITRFGLLLFHETFLEVRRMVSFLDFPTVSVSFFAEIYGFFAANASLGKENEIQLMSVKVKNKRFIKTSEII